MKILVKRLLPVVFLAAILLAGQSPESHPLDLDIAGPDGGFHLTGTLCGEISQVSYKRVPQLAGAIIGKETSWSDVRFRITLRHGEVEKGVILNVNSIPSDKPRAFVLEMYQHWDDFPDCNIDDVKFEFMKGTSETERLRQEAAARSQKQRQEAAARAQKQGEEAAARARAAYLAKIPLISSGSSVLFVASDRKCAMQFQQALAMDGLEKRKRLAELVTYNCGIIGESPVHAEIAKRDGDYVLVKLADGKHEGQSGWVPVAWVR
jgi:hypothetical protein